LKKDLLHLFIEPEMGKKIKDGSCYKEGIPNPRAEKIRYDHCIATSYTTDEGEAPASFPFIKKAKKNGKNKCPDDLGSDLWGVSSIIKSIKYEFVPKEKSMFYTATSGIPKYNKKGECKNNLGFARVGKNFYKSMDFDQLQNRAINKCPDDYEFMSMQNFESYLYEQLDDSKCQVAEQKITTEILGMESLSCMYKIFTQKSNCMDAVVNCYEHEHKWKSEFSTTIGKAAAISCGISLCEKPSVYTLFAGNDAMVHAKVITNLLSQAGMSVPELSNLHPASLAFLAFGVGMIAFVVTKTVIKKRSGTIDMDNGYENLI